MPVKKRWTHRIQFNLYDTEYNLVVAEANHKDLTQSQLLRYWFGKYTIEDIGKFKLKEVCCPTCRQIMPMTKRLQFGVRRSDYKKVRIEAKKRGIPQMRLLRVWLEICLSQELIIV